MKNTEEIWVPIKKYEISYMVSNFGRIKRNSYYTKRGKYKAARILSQRPDKDGYRFVTLCYNGISKTYFAHRIVAINFIDNPLNKPQVNHIDGNKQNNHVDNLEWVTDSENRKHAFRIGLASQSGEKNNATSLKVEDVIEIRNLYNKGGISSDKISKKYDISRGAVDFILNNETWHDPNYVRRIKSKSLIFNEDDIRNIRKMFNIEKIGISIISRKYNTDYDTIKNIILNKTKAYKHIK